MRAEEPNRVYFSRGNRKLTLRVKKLSAAKKRTVTKQTCWNGYGYVVTGYYCDEDILNEVKEVIAKEETKQEQKDAALRAELERREIQLRIDLENDLRSRYPRLPDDILSECLAPGIHAYDAQDDIPPELYSLREWKFLGGEVVEDSKPQGYVISGKGSVRHALFGPHTVSEMKSSRTNWPGERLWKGWRRGGKSDLLAAATAVQFANRLVKLSPFARSKKSFYEVKDRFLRFVFPCLVEGRRSRVETSVCWGCYGAGCYRCEASGIYSSRTLYEHHYMIDGQAFCFHSYVAPPAEKLSDQPGADLASYGRRFTLAEMRKVRYRVTEFTRMIDWFLSTRPSSAPSNASGTGSQQP